MEIQKYLDQVANLVENDHPWNEDGSKKYVSKFDGSFITLEGMEDDVKFLADPRNNRRINAWRRV